MLTARVDLSAAAYDDTYGALLHELPAKLGALTPADADVATVATAIAEMMGQQVRIQAEELLQLLWGAIRHHEMLHDRQPNWFSESRVHAGAVDR